MQFSNQYVYIIPLDDPYDIYDTYSQNYPKGELYDSLNKVFKKKLIIFVTTMTPLLCDENHSNICNHNRYNSKFDLPGKTGSRFKIHKPF